jgi:hypothetical protein
VPLGHRPRRLTKPSRVRVESDHLDSVRRERARDREAGNVAVEHEGAG